MGLPSYAPWAVARLIMRMRQGLGEQPSPVRWEERLWVSTAAQRGDQRALDLMTHFDAVLPGRVYRVFHERLLEDTEAEVRRLLEYCGLSFEEACLRFYQNERAVRTASSEQVRRPIYREGLAQWKHYAP